MKKLAFILPEAVELLDMAGPVQVFLEAQSYGLDAEIEFYKISDEVASSAGLGFGKVQKYTQANLKKGDYLFIPGVRFDSLGKLMKSDPQFIEWLVKCSDKKVKLSSICNGAFALGQAGLLDNRQSTTHWQRTEMLQSLFPETEVITDVLFVQSDHIYTSAGISAGIDLALHILEDLLGPRLTHKVARALVVYQRRSSDHNQKSIYLDYRNHINPSIHEVQDYLIDNLDTDITIEKLAQMVAMSPRNLTRVFKEKTGTTIWKYLTKLRAEKAKMLLNNPSNTMEYVAAQCGYKSARQLQRILKD